jgi:hypothetical protein
MSFLNSNNSEFLTARLTQKGRKSIAEGNFVISYFQVGDSEFDYNFTGFTGQGTIPHQKVLAPFDKDTQVKYPYKLTPTESLTYGNPIRQNTLETIKNVMGPAGFVSDYHEYDSDACTGTTINCEVQEIDLSKVDGTNILTVLTGETYNGCEYITVLFNNRTVNDIPTLTENSSSLVYKIISIDGNEITLDRVMPDFTSLSGYAQVICHNCNVEYGVESTVAPVCSPNPVDPADAHDPWRMEFVWTQKPAGLDDLNETLLGYTGTQYASTKEYLGYTSSSGQTFTNFTGGTISHPTSYLNSFDEEIELTPEETKVIAIIHFSELGDSINDPERFFKYDDYIAGEDSDDIDSFEVYIPFLMYHRNPNLSTIGAVFHMDDTNYYVTSSKNDKPNTNNVVFRYLLDENNYKVGKIFTGKKIIVIDDQEIVAALEYKSNRRFTLPAPRVSSVPVDLPCAIGDEPIIITGETAYLTYLLEYTGDTALSGLHCNYYSKITGSTSCNISLKFKTDDFKYMNHDASLYASTTGFRANKFSALVQIVSGKTQPETDGWVKIDITDQIPNHTIGNMIDPVNLCNKQYVITKNMFDNDGVLYSIGDNSSITDFLIGNQPDLTLSGSTLPQFGDSQPFAGSVKLTRATDVEVMTFMINLPSSQFTETQNPTYITGSQKRITEVALLDENKYVLAMSKTAKPVLRSGTQVFAVKIDF